MDKVDSKKEIITEIEPEEINLKSFENKPSLNEKIWVNDKINSRVRLKLLDIADSFFNTLDIDWVEVKDIVFTGSLANYNWSKYSDIDLHILIDFNDVDENKTLVKNYLDSKKNEWNKTHDNIISNTDPGIINKTSNTYEFGIEIDSPEFEKFETLILNSDLWENVRRDDSKKYSELAKLLSEYFYPIEDGRIKF